MSVVESNGLLALYKGSPADNNSLTFRGESSVTVLVNGVYYSDNTDIDSTPTQPVHHLVIPTSSKIEDTIPGVWKVQGFDIVEDAYPVAFPSSGVIVISAKIVNHTTSELPVQAQGLLDNFHSSTAGATLMMGQQLMATAFVAGASDSVTETFRTAFGVPPDSLFNSSVEVRSEIAGVGNFGIYPNPLSRYATLSFALDARCDVSISVLDQLGRELDRLLSSKEEPAGANSLSWDASALLPGVYTCRHLANGVVRSTRFVVAR